MGFNPFKAIGGALKGAVGGLLSGGPAGAIVGGLGGAAGSILGGGNVGDALKAGALGALGGMGGQAAGMDPAMIAAMSGLTSNILTEQAKNRQMVEDQMNYRNQLGQRQMGLAEGVYADKAPMRQMGMGALGNYFSQNPAGMFAATDPSNPGNLFPDSMSRSQGFVPGGGMPGLPSLPSLPTRSAGPPVDTTGPVMNNVNSIVKNLKSQGGPGIMTAGPEGTARQTLADLSQMMAKTAAGGGTSAPPAWSPSTKAAAKTAAIPATQKKALEKAQAKINPASSIGRMLASTLGGK